VPHEAGLRRVLERFLVPGGCFWDVGANYGYYTGIFSEPRYSQSRVVAFEPNPRLVARLTHDMATRNNVTIFAAAVGTDDGEAELHIPQAGTACGSLRPIGGENVKVLVRSVDSLLAEGQPLPNVMKIDVEGWEAAVLDGFRRKGEVKPVIHFEHIEWAALEAGSSFERIWQILTGWRIYRVEEDGGLRATGLEHPRTTNDLIAVHPDDERFKVAESLVKDYR
jgi:FkbM family methyltransferase